MANTKANSKAEELYKIYKGFTEQIKTQGWNGEFYGWEENVRNDGKGSQWMYFELANGFRIGLDEPGGADEDEVTLTYWFDNDSGVDVINVESLEQLLELIN